MVDLCAIEALVLHIILIGSINNVAYFIYMFALHRGGLCLTVDVFCLKLL